MIPRILSNRVNLPHAIHPAKAHAILNVLASRDGMSVQYTNNAPRASLEDDVIMGAIGEEYGDKIWTVVDGLMLVNVRGTLVDESGSFQPMSGETGYDGLTAALKAAAVAEDVRGVVFDVKSCGGLCSGLFPLADRIAAFDKPTLAIVNDHAYSAAYAIASQCDSIALAPYTGSVGSVGVVCTHVDMEAYLEKEGFNVTMIHAGARKVDGNEYEALPEGVRAEFQRGVDRLYGDFVSLVARGRSLSEQQVRATEAGTFDLQDAIDVGFADEIIDPMAALQKFSDQLASSSGLNQSTGGIMSDNPEAVLSAEDSAQAIASARSAGVAEERERMSAILSHPKASAYPEVARAAIAKGADADTVSAIFDAMPSAEADAAAEDVEPKAEIDVQAIASKAANDAVKAMLDASGGADVQPDAEAAPEKPIYGSV